MSYFFPCEIDDAIQYINLGNLASFSCHIFKVYFIFKSFSQVLLSFPVIYSSFLNNYIIMVNSEMKYYWIASIIKMKMGSHQEYVVCL